MRRVRYKKWVGKADIMGNELVEAGEAFFHGWVVDSDGEIIAILELDSGRVDDAHHTLITFIDRPPPSVTDHLAELVNVVRYHLELIGRVIGR